MTRKQSSGKQHAAKHPRRFEHDTDPKVAAEEVGALDETLTEVTTTTAQKLRKYGPYILGLAILAALAAGAYRATIAVQESSLAARNGRLWQMVQGPDTRGIDSPAADPAAIDALLAEAKGKREEPFFLKTVGEYWLARATSDAQPEAGADTATPAADDSSVEAAREAAKIADQALASFATDPDLKRWAEGVKATLASRDEGKWTPPTEAAPTEETPAEDTLTPTPAGQPEAAAPDATAPAAETPAAPPAAETETSTTVAPTKDAAPANPVTAPTDSGAGTDG